MQTPLPMLRIAKRSRFARIALASAVCGGCFLPAHALAQVQWEYSPWSPAGAENVPTAGGIHDPFDVTGQMQKDHWSESRGSGVGYVEGKGYTVDGVPGYYQYNPGAQPTNRLHGIIETEEIRKKREAQDDAERVEHGVQRLESSPTVPATGLAARYQSPATQTSYAPNTQPSPMAGPMFPPPSMSPALAPAAPDSIAPLAAATAVAPEEPSRWRWPWSYWTDDEPVGSAEWWKKNKKHAIFEPGKGYKLEGIDGYFDQTGRPLDRPVTLSAAPHPDIEDDEERGLLPGLDPRITYGRVKNAIGLGPDDQVAHEFLMEGERLFEAKRYKSAAKQYDKAAKRAVDMRLKEDAMFMKAESYYFDDRSIKARDAYDALAEKYPSSRYLDKVVAREWAIAQFLEKYEEYRPDWLATPNAWDERRPWFDTIGHAIKTYENIRMNDPTGPRADDALMATANIYFRRGRYDDADYHYTLLRREYPRSEFQFEAHLLGLQAKLRKYQGEDYDGTPLEEAQALVKQLRTNFAGQLSAEERERLQVVSGQLHKELATRDMRMAKYYDNTKQYGAAKEYYAEVIRKYPRSVDADAARERIAQISTEPDEPPKRLAWFVEQFPKSEQHAAMANVPEIRDGTLIARQPESPAEPSTATAPPADVTR